MNEHAQEELRNDVIASLRRPNEDGKKVQGTDEAFVASGAYDRFALWLDEAVVDTSSFELFSGTLILTSAVLTGIQEDSPDYYRTHPDAPVNRFDFIIVHIFCLECLINIIAEGSTPWRYFIGDGMISSKSVELGAANERSDSLRRSLLAFNWDTRARWNCFDFFVSYSSAVFAYDVIRGTEAAGGVIALLRLFRALRLLSLMQRFEELRVILEGFAIGLDSFTYIGALLLLLFYIYAILAIYMFADNDPAHFGTLTTAMLSLYRTTTLANWQELLYINWYGCDKFPGGAYVMPAGRETTTLATDASVLDDDKWGGGLGNDAEGAFDILSRPTYMGEFPAFICSKPTASPVSAFIVFFSFTLLSSYVILSLLVGVVTIAMQVTMTGVHESNLRQLRDERLQLSHKNEPIIYMRYVYGGKSGKVPLYDFDTGLPQVELLEPVISKKPRVGQRVRGRLQRELTKASEGAKSQFEEEEFVFGEESSTRATMAHLMRNAIRGKAEVDPEDVPGNALRLTSRRQRFGFLFKPYLALGQRCRDFVASDLYTITLVVLIAMYAMLVGVETTLRNNPIVGLLQTVCVWVFASECVIKIVAEGTKPWAYFRDGWNVFDFVIASGGVASLLSGGSTNPVIQLARLLRLAQVFKLAGRLPRLQLVMESLLYGLRSMLWVFVFFILFNYLFAIGGMIAFRDNDPFFFGGIMRSLSTLWMVETLNNWEIPMNVNIYGCANYGYGTFSDTSGLMGPSFYHLPAKCTQSFASGGLAVLYFLTVVTFGGLMLPTLLTAVITSSTVHMGSNKEARAKIATKVEAAMELLPEYLHEDRVQLFTELFENLDVSGDGHLEPIELIPAFTALSDDILRHATPSLIKNLFMLVDKSDDGTIDLSELMTFFSRLTSAMALKLDLPPHEHVQDPELFMKLFAVLLKELAIEEGTSKVDAVEEDEDDEQSHDKFKRRKASLIKRQKARVLAIESGGNEELEEALPGSTAWVTSGAAAQSEKHQADTIYNVSDAAQLHRHIKWLAAQMESVAAEGAAAKRELESLRHLLGANDRAPPCHASTRASLLPQPAPGAPRRGYPQPAVAAEGARRQRVKALLASLSADLQGDHAPYRDQWESKLAATRSSGGIAAVAAAACQKLHADGCHGKERPRASVGSAVLLVAGQPVLDGDSATSNSSNPEYAYLASVWAAESSIAATASNLAQDWVAASLLAAETSAAADEVAVAETECRAAEDLPMAHWLTNGGWRQLKHASKNPALAHANAKMP